MSKPLEFYTNGFANFWNNMSHGIGNFFGRMIFGDKYSHNSVASSLLNKVTGAGLTGAEEAQNVFNAREAERQRNWEGNLAATQYQRGVSDMSAAGVNPAVMFGSGQPAPTPSGAVASSGSFSPSGLGDLMQLLLLPAQLSQLKAQTKNIEADTANKNVQTDLNQQLFDLNERLNPLVVESKNISNNLGRKQIELMNSELDQVVENTKKLAQETKESEKRTLYYDNLAELERIKADQAVELFPYTVQLSQAQNQAAKAAAALSMAQAAYQRKLLSSDYIESIFAQAKAQAKSQEAAAAIDDLISRIKTGRAFDFGDSIAGQIASGLINYPIAALSYLAEPVLSVVKVGVGANALKKMAPTSSLNAPTELAGLAGIE